MVTIAKKRIDIKMSYKNSLKRNYCDKENDYNLPSKIPKIRVPKFEFNETTHSAFENLPKYLQNLIRQKNELKGASKNVTKSKDIEYKILDKAVVLELKHLKEKLKRNNKKIRLMPVRDEFPKFLKRTISENIKDRMIHRVLENGMSSTRCSATTSAVKKLLTVYSEKQKISLKTMKIVNLVKSNSRC